MTDTGKKARRIFGTRFDAKKAKKRKGKHFVTPDIKVRDYPNGDAAYALARRLGFDAPHDIGKSWKLRPGF